ncbi:hypothetical protein pb186bvf_001124 [Paramecium bursaria]
MSNRPVQNAAKFKLVFIGDQSVGKTSIIARFVYETIPEQHQPTIGIDFLSKCINIDGKTVRLQLWDTAGQERFRSLIPSYIRDSNAAILCYDVTNLSTFENISRWLDYVKEERGSDVLTILVANKIDVKQNRVVSQEEGAKYAKENDMLYFECSAKEGTNITGMFKDIGITLLGPSDQTAPQSQADLSEKQPTGQKLSDNQPQIVQKEGGCNC